MSRTLVVALVLVVGCEGKERTDAERENKKVTTKTEYDASTGFIDEDYRFEVKSPGPGWKVMRESDARHLNVDAIAGISRANIQSVAIVEALPDATLDSYVDLVVASMKLEDKKDERTKTTVSGIPAIDIKVEGKFNDMRVIYRGRLLVHQDHGYQFLAFTPSGQGTSDDLDRAIAAYSIVPGKVKGRRTNVVIEDQIGVGWWIDGGVFESAATRLRVKAPKGWRLMAGDELRKNNNDAEIGLAGTEHNIYIAIVTEPIDTTDEKKYVAGRHASTLENMKRLDGEPTVRAKVLGRDVELTRARMNDAPFEYLLGIVFVDKRAYQFSGWFPASQRKTVEPQVLAAMSSIEMLSTEAAAKLATRLAAEPDHQNQVGATHALRSGTFYDFAHRVRWKMPSGFWTVLGGQEARANNGDAMLLANEVTSGLFTQLIVESGADFNNDSYHTLVEQALVKKKFKPVRRGDVRLAGRPAKMTEGMLPTEDLSLHYRVTTAVIDGTAIQVATWAAQGSWPKDERITEITAAVDVVSSQRDTEERSEAYHDNRLGFSMALGTPWRRVDITPKELRPIASAQQWSNGSAEVVVLAIFTVEQRDETWFLDLMEQLMRQQFAKHSGTKPKTTTSKLDGRSARHLTWNTGSQRLDAMLIKRDATFYMLGTIASGSSDSTLDLASEGFHLLP